MDKETIKEFLKPDLANISLFVAICLIGVFVGSNFLGYLAWGKSEVRTTTFYAEFNSFFWFPLKLVYGDTSMIFMHPKMEKLAFPLLLTVIYWYLLSCLIIFSYNKFRTKNK